MADQELELARARAKAKLKIRNQAPTSEPTSTTTPDREFIPNEQEEARFAPTALESASAGVIQGATSNFADDVASPDTAQAFETAETANPMANLAGNVAESIAQGLAFQLRKFLI